MNNGILFLLSIRDLSFVFFIIHFLFKSRFSMKCKSFYEMLHVQYKYSFLWENLWNGELTHDSWQCKYCKTGKNTRLVIFKTWPRYNIFCLWAKLWHSSTIHFPQWKSFFFFFSVPGKHWLHPPTSWRGQRKAAAFFFHQENPSFSVRTFNFKPSAPSSLAAVWLFLLCCCIQILWIAVDPCKNKQIENPGV